MDRVNIGLTRNGGSVAEQLESPAAPANGVLDLNSAVDQILRLRDAISRRIVGHQRLVEGVVAGLLANGHVLIEGVPGLGKTLLVRTLSEVLAVSFSRIQFTPDLMPGDITGTNVLRNDGDGARIFEFQRGPIFANLILADEINRATPKTQSALLEAMEEGRVTASGK